MTLNRTELLPPLATDAALALAAAREEALSPAWKFNVT
jgi:hypothetical protein